MTDATRGCEGRPPPELVRGIEEFNRREFYACHETLEALWIGETGPVRELYQGIIQVAVGFYHLEHGNFVGAVRTMRRGLERLEHLPPTCRGVAVDALVSDTRTALQRLVELGPARLERFDPHRIPVIGFLTCVHDGGRPA